MNMKFWNKWLRKSHRWLAIPMLILIPISLILKLTGNGAVIASIPQWEALQSLLILFLALSGAYLYFLPYLNKWKRNRRQARVRVPINKQTQQETIQ